MLSFFFFLFFSYTIVLLMILIFFCCLITIFADITYCFAVKYSVQRLILHSSNAPTLAKESSLFGRFQSKMPVLSSTSLQIFSKHALGNSLLRPSYRNFISAQTPTSLQIEAIMNNFDCSWRTISFSFEWWVKWVVLFLQLKVMVFYQHHSICVTLQLNFQ